jgi:ubiquitin-protein ligase E3 C
MPVNPVERFERFAAARASGGSSRRQHATVRRGHVAEDGFDRLASADLTAPIAITFIDAFGNEEAGIDGGGVFKEFFTELSKEVFDTDRGLWLANKRNELYPNPHQYATECEPSCIALRYVVDTIEAHSLSWYRFIGRILGKAMYEGILVEVAFAGFFLSKVCPIIPWSQRTPCLPYIVAWTSKLPGRSRLARS